MTAPPLCYHAEVIPSDGSQDKSVFKHTALQLDEKQIRLLTVQAGTSPSIECTLRRASLNSRYTCLSYEWKQADDLRSITINGGSFQVRPNLYGFLLAMRERLNHGLDTPDLWIDAICINQSKLDERNHQVQIMAEIYQRADQVLIWLGQVDHLCRYNAIPLEGPITVWSKSAVITSWLDVLREVAISSYFQRTWIIQEMLLAPRLVLMLGTEIVDVPSLAEAIMSKPHRLVNPSCNTLLLLCKVQQRDLTFEQAMGLSRSSICEDPRDKVYAMLGVCHEFKHLPVDYNISVKELFIETLLHLRPKLSGLHRTLGNLESVFGLTAMPICPGQGLSNSQAELVVAYKQNLNTTLVCGRTQIIFFEMSPWNGSPHRDHQLEPGIPKFYSDICSSSKWLVFPQVHQQHLFYIDWGNSRAFSGQLVLCFREKEEARDEVDTVARLTSMPGLCHDLWHRDSQS